MALDLGRVVGDVVQQPQLARAPPNARRQTPRIRWVITWRLPKPKFAAAAMAAKYPLPSADDSGAQASWRSGSV